MELQYSRHPGVRSWNVALVSCEAKNPEGEAAAIEVCNAADLGVCKGASVCDDQHSQNECEGATVRQGQDAGCSWEPQSS